MLLPEESDPRHDIIQDAAVILGTQGPSLRLSDLSRLLPRPRGIDGGTFRATLRRTLSESGGSVFRVGSDGPDPWVSLVTAGSPAHAADRDARMTDEADAGRGARSSRRSSRDGVSRERGFRDGGSSRDGALGRDSAAPTRMAYRSSSSSAIAGVGGESGRESSEHRGGRRHHALSQSLTSASSLSSASSSSSSSSSSLLAGAAPPRRGEADARVPIGASSSMSSLPSPAVFVPPASSSLHSSGPPPANHPVRHGTGPASSGTRAASSSTSTSTAHSSSSSSAPPSSSLSSSSYSASSASSSSLSGRDAEVPRRSRSRVEDIAADYLTSSATEMAGARKGSLRDRHPLLFSQGSRSTSTPTGGAIPRGGDDLRAAATRTRSSHDLGDARPTRSSPNRPPVHPSRAGHGTAGEQAPPPSRRDPGPAVPIGRSESAGPPPPLSGDEFKLDGGRDPRRTSSLNQLPRTTSGLSPAGNAHGRRRRSLSRSSHGSDRGSGSSEYGSSYEYEYEYESGDSAAEGDGNAKAKGAHQRRPHHHHGRHDGGGGGDRQGDQKQQEQQQHQSRSRSSQRPRRGAGANSNLSRVNDIDGSFAVGGGSGGGGGGDDDDDGADGEDYDRTTLSTDSDTGSVSTGSSRSRDPAARREEAAFTSPQRDVFAEESDGSISMDEDEDPSKVDHLIFVVHGIGGGLLGGARVEHHRTTFDNTMHAVLEEHYKDVHLKMHFELIEWRSSLAEYSAESDRLVKLCTPKGVKRMRDFANDIFLDALYFLHNVYNRAIVEEVTRQLNDKYEAFRRKHRNFSGKVSIFAHSLGAVIVYDILQLTSAPMELYSMGSSHGIADLTRLKDGGSPRLSPQQAPRAPGSPSPGGGPRSSSGLGKSRSAALRFHVENLFQCGSPLGVFLAIRRTTLGRDFLAPNGVTNFFSMSHPYDPVAYRVEPLVDPVYEEVEPARIPLQAGEERLHKSLKDKILDKFGYRKERKVPEGQSDPVTERPRIDYAIQESILEAGSEYIVALRAHHCYWAHKDIALFVLKRILATSDFFYLV